MNGGVALATVLGTVVGLGIVLGATYFHLGDVVVAAGGVVVLAAVGVMTLAIARVEEEVEEHGGHP